MKILFLVKLNSEYGSGMLPSKSGLRNSARFVVDAVNHFPNTHAVMEFCADGNEVNKYLCGFRPDICIIEAIWVAPEKLKELIAIHPTVKFLIRVHSRMPFLSMEGNAIKWIKEYENYATVSFNHAQTASEFQEIGIRNLYLPNIYPVVKYVAKHQHHHRHLYKIGCFGAIRPFKNQLAQAVAAILFATKRNAVVHFYINSTRIEQRGESILKNLRALFENTRHKLIEIDWLSHDEFLKIVSQMDACMQVSYTETFNIVTADAIACHVPVVVSDQIDWLNCEKADPNYETDMSKVLGHIIDKRAEVIEDNITDLATYNHHSITRWFRFLER